MAMTLGEIAVRYGLELAGDPGASVSGVAPLASATPGTLTFCTGAKFRRALAATRATVVVLPREMVAECPVAALVSPRPYASYARIAAGLHPPVPVRPLNIDSTNNRIGIGTSTPTDTLSINGATYLAPISAPAVTTDRLYNISNDLYWGGNLLAGSAVGS